MFGAKLTFPSSFAATKAKEEKEGQAGAGFGTFQRASCISAVLSVVILMPATPDPPKSSLYQTELSAPVSHQLVWVLQELGVRGGTGSFNSCVAPTLLKGTDNVDPVNRTGVAEQTASLSGARRRRLSTWENPSPSDE